MINPIRSSLYMAARCILSSKSEGVALLFRQRCYFSMPNKSVVELRLQITEESNMRARKKFSESDDAKQVVVKGGEENSQLCEITRSLLPCPDFTKEERDLLGHFLVYPSSKELPGKVADTSVQGKPELKK